MNLLPINATTIAAANQIELRVLIKAGISINNPMSTKKQGINKTLPINSTFSLTGLRPNTSLTAKPARNAPTIFSTPITCAPTDATNNASKINKN